MLRKRITLILVVVSMMSNCSGSNGSNNSGHSTANVVSDLKSAKSSTIPSQSSTNNTKANNADLREPSHQEINEIREVDFKNFTYPIWKTIEDYLPPKTKTITMSGGKFATPFGGKLDPVSIGIPNISYYDLTGDAKEEALVTLVAILYPHGSSGCTFVYSWEDKKPKLVWQYEFGSGAYAGLRKLSVEDGDIVIEQYIWDKSVAYCCPEKFSRSTYKWDGKKFQEIKSEILLNESKEAEFLGYP